MLPHVAAARVLVGSLSRQEFLATDWGTPTAERWEQLLQSAQREGLGGVLAEEFSRLAGWSKLGGPFQRTEFLRSVAHQKLVLEVAAIARSLSTEGMILKGTALVQTAYRGRIGLRPIGDVDVVLPETRLPDFEAALVNHGFRRVEEGSLSFQRGDDLVDLHGDLLNERRVPSRRRAYDLDAARLRHGSSGLQGPLSGLRVPDPIDHLVFLSVHALKHSHSRLFWLVDIALLSSHCDPEKLLERARQTGTGRPLAYALSLVDRVLGLASPVQSRVPYSLLESVYLHWVARRGNVYGAGELLTCLSLPSWGAVGVYLAELLWPAQGEPRTPGQRLRRAARRLLG